MVIKKTYNKRTRKKSEVILPKIWDRGRLVETSMVGSLLQVYTGKLFITIKVSPIMVGYKLGHFVWTRKAKVEHKRKT